MNKLKKALLEDLIELIAENSEFEGESYHYYQNIIEKWQTLGFYDDSMLYFWYYERIEGLDSSEFFVYMKFCEVVESLGIKMPSAEQSRIINTHNYLDKLLSLTNINDKAKQIWNFWLAFEDGECHDCYDFHLLFSKVRNTVLLETEKSPTVEKYELEYQKIITLIESWKATHSSKEEIYNELINL